MSQVLQPWPPSSWVAFADFVTIKITSLLLSRFGRSDQTLETKTKNNETVKLENDFCLILKRQIQKEQNHTATDLGSHRAAITLCP